MNDFPKLKKYWKVIQKKDAKESEESRAKLSFERHFLQKLMHKFLSLLATIPLEGNVLLFPTFFERFFNLHFVTQVILISKQFTTVNVSWS